MLRCDEAALTDRAAPTGASVAPDELAMGSAAQIDLANPLAAVQTGEANTCSQRADVEPADETNQAMHAEGGTSEEARCDASAPRPWERWCRNIRPTLKDKVGAAYQQP